MSSPRPKFLMTEGSSPPNATKTKKKRDYKLEEILSHTSWPESPKTQRSEDHREPNRTPLTTLGGHRKGPPQSPGNKLRLGMHPPSLQRDQCGWEGSSRCQDHTPLPVTPQLWQGQMARQTSQRLLERPTLFSAPYAVSSCDPLVWPQHSVPTVSTSHRLLCDSPYTTVSQFSAGPSCLTHTPDAAGLCGAAVLPSQIREHLSFHECYLEEIGKAGI